MSTTEDKLAKYLIEARAMELALVRTLQAHVAMTPRGAYRSDLEQHLGETRGHAERLATRIGELEREQSLVESAYDVGQRAVAQLLALGKAPLDMVRATSAEERLLKNAKDEIATEALEIATYDALERLADLAGDAETARLAASHRADEERMLAALRSRIPELVTSVVTADVAPESEEGARAGDERRGAAGARSDGELTSE